MHTFKKSAMKYKDANGVMQDVGAMCSVNETDTTLTKSGVAADAKVSGDKLSKVNTDITELNRQIKVERERVNTFTTLGEGSTTGDAELADARVDKDGNTHGNVGEHIRSVSTQLSKEIGDVESRLSESMTNISEDVKKIIDVSPNLFEFDGYGLYTEASLESDDSTSYWYSKMIPCKMGDVFRITKRVAWLAKGIAFFDKDGNQIVLIAGCYNQFFDKTNELYDEITIRHFTSTESPNNLSADNLAFVRFSFSKYDSVTTQDLDMVVKNADYPSCYIPKGKTKFIIKKLNGVKWVAFGDSLTDSATLSEQSEKKNYVDYVSESLGLSTTNCGVGGSGYKKNNNFVNRVSTIPLDTEILTVFGSFNDYEFIKDNLGQLGDTTTDTLYGSMYAFLNGVFERCPNIVVGIITPTPWSWENDWNTSDSAVQYTNNYVNALIETARKWSIPVLDLYHESNLRPWIKNFRDEYYRDDNSDGVNDGVHPLDNAHKKFIAPKIEAFIESIYNVY